MHTPCRRGCEHDHHLLPLLQLQLAQASTATCPLPPPLPPLPACVQAPMFEMDFFQGFVAPTLHDAYTGWGLDFVW